MSSAELADSLAVHAAHGTMSLADAIALQERQKLKLAKESAVAGKKRKMASIYNKPDGDAAEKEQPWRVHMSVSVEVGQIDDVHDDITREAAFQAAALEAVGVARNECREAGIKFSRPLDYYAEMVKSDVHMEKMRKQLHFEQKKVEAVERRRKEQAAKKMGKAVQRNIEQEKRDQKRGDLDALTKYRKQRERNAAGGLDDIDEAALFGTAGEPEKKRQRTGQAGPSRDHGPSKRREAKNRKYGLSGTKPKDRRKNSADSAADFKDFSARKNKTFDGKPKSLPKAARASASRPGKSRRQAKR